MVVSTQLSWTARAAALGCCSLAAVVLATGTAQPAWAAIVWQIDGASGNNVVSDPLGTGTDGLAIHHIFGVEYLVVAGGGGGGAGGRSAGGGGGAGGLLTNVYGTPLGITADTYPVVVGAGGTRGIRAGEQWGRRGQPSSAFGLTAIGGGGGAYSGGGSNQTAGGSGGGDHSRDDNRAGSGTEGQGNAGGRGAGDLDARAAGGGGGGAGAPGGNATSSSAGHGGAGAENSITGASVLYAGGGGGAALSPATPGSGAAEGGDGGHGGAGSHAQPNTGSGGGGGTDDNDGGDGGSGIVVIRYEGDPAATGGTVVTDSVPGSTVHSFAIGGSTTSGQFEFDMRGVDLDARLGTTITAPISGAGGLTYTGPGRLTLAADNDYTGATLAEGGALLVNGSLPNTSAVTVESGAVLGGIGAIGGPTTIRGRHTPGASAGVQTFFSDLTYDAGAEIVWDLFGNTNAQQTPAVFDQVAVGGDLDFASPTAFILSFDAPGSEVDWADPFWQNNHNWLVYDLAGTTSNFENLALAGDAWLDAAGAGLNTVHPIASFSLYQGGHNVFLSYAVPEPGTWLMLLAAAACGLLVRRRR